MHARTHARTHTRACTHTHTHTHTHTLLSLSPLSYTQLMEVGAKGLQERQAQKAAQEAARLAAAREQSKPVDPKEALADALVEEVGLPFCSFHLF